MLAFSVKAQKVQVVDASGYGIALVNVSTADGVLIGTTDLNGVLEDVKGNKIVSVRHLAYKPRTVALADLSDGRITMEEDGFELSEAVVKPRPLVYTEVYYRIYAYINDSLRCYHAGIVPCAYDTRKKKIKFKFSDYSCTVFNLKDVSWWLVKTQRMAKGGVMKLYPGEVNLTNGRWKKSYDIEKVPDGPNRWKIVNPIETVGHLVRSNGMSTLTLDGGRAQMYANQIHGQEKLLKRRQEANYTYQYTEVFRINEDGNVDREDYVMSLNHWELDRKKGHETYIVEAYVTGNGYMTDDEFKQKRKDLDALNSTHNMWHMSLQDLEAYERAHNIQPLTPELRKAVDAITRYKKKLNT